MQIGNIKINSFKGIQDYSFAPDKVNLFIGKNGSGKSSFLEAIRFSLTGELPDNAIRNGCKTGYVSASIFGGTEIKRFFGEKKTVQIAGKTTTQKAAKQYIEENSGVRTDTMNVITLSSLIASMNAGELSSFLVQSGLLPIEIDINKLFDFCKLSEAAKDELGVMLPLPPATFGISAITDAYEVFYNRRADIKRELDTVKKKAVYTGAIPTKTLESIERAMGEITMRKQQKTAYETALWNYQQALKKRQEAVANVQALEEKIKECNVKEPDPSLKERIVKQIEENNAELAKKQSTINVLQANIALFQNSLRNLSTSVCPLSDKLICTTDKTAAKQEITEILETNQAKLEETQKDIEALASKLEAIKKQDQEYELQLNKFRQLQSLYEQYRFMKANVPEIPEEPKPIPSSEEDEKRLQLLHEQRNAIIAYNLAKQADEERKCIQKKLDVYEELVKALAPKSGISEKIIAFAFEPLIKHCNKRAASLKSDFEIAAQVSKGVHIMCKPTKESGFLDIKEVSSGEQLLAIFLIADMLNELSGFRIMMLDDLDKLDENSLSSLLSLIMDDKVLNSYDHIFLATVDHPDAVEIFKRYGAQIKTICL